jgi:proton glutamate symport protein
MNVAITVRAAGRGRALWRRSNPASILAAVTARLSRLAISPPLRALAALVLGLTIGLAASEWDSAGTTRAVRAIEPLGTMWVNAIRMTVLPLIVASLVVAVSGAAPATVGRLGARALVVFVLMMAALGVLAAIVVPAVFSRLAVDPAAAQAIRASAAPVQRPELPTFGSWLVGLVPVNPVKAAADGAMLPLVVFTLVFGLALGRVSEEPRRAVMAFFRGVSEAMTVLIGWILALAPIGIFALALSLATTLGTEAIGAALFYVVAMSALLLASTALLYVFVALFASVPVGRFARAVLPAQIVAVTTRSSMAPLPLLLTSAEQTLGLPRTVTSFTLPLASSTFRYCQPLTWQGYAALAGALYGITLGIPEIATLAVTSILMSFSVPGIPSGGLFVVAPFLAAVGIPVEVIGVLIALDLVPDVFKSLTNVTAHLAAVTLVAPRSGVVTALDQRPGTTI